LGLVGEKVKLVIANHSDITKYGDGLYEPNKYIYNHRLPENKRFIPVGEFVTWVVESALERVQ
jgi:hypothetical protein